MEEGGEKDVMTYEHVKAKLTITDDRKRPLFPRGSTSDQAYAKVQVLPIKRASTVSSIQRPSIQDILSNDLIIGNTPAINPLYTDDPGLEAAYEIDLRFPFPRDLYLYAGENTSLPTEITLKIPRFFFTRDSSSSNYWEYAQVYLWAIQVVPGAGYQPDFKFGDVVDPAPESGSYLNQEFVFRLDQLFPDPEIDEMWSVPTQKERVRQFTLPEKSFGNNAAVIQWAENKTIKLYNIEKHSISIKNEVTDKNVGTLGSIYGKDFANIQPKNIELEGTLGDVMIAGDEITNRDDRLKKLYNLFENKKPFVFYSDMIILQNAIISGMSVTQDESANSYQIALNISEINFFEPMHTTIDVEYGYHEVLFDPPSFTDIDYVTKEEREEAEGEEITESERVAKMNIGP